MDKPSGKQLLADHDARTQPRGRWSWSWLIGIVVGIALIKAISFMVHHP
ncbi:MAG: hypothetical protein KIT67_18685 [Alphaproteobacteria bacterium]|nr:hypothetical protein [Alphaproteobacteria bacterium]